MFLMFFVCPESRWRQLIPDGILSLWGEFRQPPSAMSVMSQSQEIMGHRRAALDGEHNLWQPPAAEEDRKTCQMVRTLKMHVFPVFFVLFLCSSPYHEVSGGEGGCPTLKVKGLFLWIWWIKPRICSHSSSLPPFIPSYFWIHSPPLSSLSPSPSVSCVFQWILQRRY